MNLFGNQGFPFFFWPQATRSLFKNIGEKGVFARIITDEDGKKITEIRVFAFKKKNKDK